LKEGGVHAYRICGLAVESAIPLPGLIARESGAADVTILLGEVPLDLPGAVETHPTYQVAGERFALRIPHIARFLLEGGRRITVALEEDADDADAAIFILGTVFGILLHQRGDFVLHASAVRVGGRAVLFAGPSGAGKSTLAAALVRRGYAMITDDVCAVAAGRVLSDGRQLKLWANAIDRLDLSAARGGPVRNKLQKFYVEPAAADDTPLPVGAVYMPRETRPPAEDGIEIANIVDATLMLRHNAYRPRLVKALAQDNFYLQSAAALVGKAGVFVFRRPLDFRALDEGLDRLEAHWRSIGLLDAQP
jgi:HPr serine kinase-like protein